MKIIITTDGSTRPTNPGPMEVGGFCRTECGRGLGYFNKKIGKGTNNEAEYWAAFYGIRKAVELGATSMELELDSQLVCMQLQGHFQVKKAKLRKIKAAITRECQNLPLEIKWNKRNVGARPIADALSRGAIKNAVALIEEKFPDTPTGGLVRWETLPALEDLDLDALELDFHTFDMTGDWD